MKKIRDFKCPSCKRQFEALVEDKSYLRLCYCGDMAERLVNSARYFSNTVGKSPSAKD